MLIGDWPGMVGHPFFRPARRRKTAGARPFDSQLRIGLYRKT
jgi:hypothetical protein